VPGVLSLLQIRNLPTSYGGYCVLLTQLSKFRFNSRGGCPRCTGELSGRGKYGEVCPKEECPGGEMSYTRELNGSIPDPHCPSISESPMMIAVPVTVFS